MGKAGGRGQTAGGGYLTMSVGMMRYRLRTLLIVLAILPPLLAWAWWAWVTFEGLLLLALLFVLPNFLFLVPPLIDWLLGVKNQTVSPDENRSTLPDR